MCPLNSVSVSGLVMMLFISFTCSFLSSVLSSYSSISITAQAVTYGASPGVLPRTGSIQVGSTLAQK
jgi:hypothetical protein